MNRHWHELLLKKDKAEKRGQLASTDKEVVWNR